MEKPQTRKIAKTFEIPALSARALFTPDSLDETSRTVELCWTTGASVRRFDWSSYTEFNEELSLNPKHINADRMNSGAPLLNAHRSSTILDQIGVVVPNSLRFSGDKAFAKVKFSDREDVEPIFRDVKNGIICNVSVGYRVFKYEDVSENDDKVKTLRAIDWEPMELSLVPIGADAGAGVRSSEKVNECIIETIEQEKKENRMDPKKENEVKVNDIDADKIRKDSELEGSQKEKKRISEIHNLIRTHSLDESFGKKLIDNDSTIEKAREAILNELATRSDQSKISSRVEVGRDISVESRREGMAQAILHRANPVEKLPDVAKEYRGMSLIDMARESIEVAGGKTRGLTKREIAAIVLNTDSGLKSRAGMQATSDFPEILANTIGRTLNKAYEQAPRTFLPFCRKSTASDFKQIARTQLSEMSNFEFVPQGGEYKSVVFGDKAEKYSLGKYGGVVRVTWESLVNDDLDAFNRIPFAIAQEAAATESDIVYGILTGNPVMADTVALFHATHANYTGTGTAISDVSLGVARAMFRKQTGLLGKRILNLAPKFLIVGPDKEAEANKYTSAMYVASSPANINPQFNTSLTTIAEGRITGNLWFMAGDYNQTDTIEYCYLEGDEGIYTEQRYGFEVDGLEVKARHIFAAKAIDHRNLYKNNGN